MRMCTRQLAVIVGILLSVQTGWGQGVGLSTDPIKGRKVFLNKSCSSCHSVLGEGGSIGPDLGRVDLGKSLYGISGAMWNHAPTMNVLMGEMAIDHPLFSVDEMADLLAYLYFINYLDEPGNPESGKRLVEEKKCLLCHSIGSRGGSSASKLDKVAQYASPISMAQLMWNEGPIMHRQMKQMGVPQPKFTKNELADIFAYIHKVSTIRNKNRIYVYPGSASKGELLFNTKGCIKCHRVGGLGESVGPDLTRVEFHKGVTQIAGNMWNHGPAIWQKMREMGIEEPKFYENEMADLISYLYFLRYFGEGGDSRNGKSVFKEMRCLGCHSVGGEGKGIGPDLAKSSAILSPVVTATVMWNHIPRMLQLMTEKGILWPRFREHEWVDLMAYLRSIQEQQ